MSIRHLHILYLLGLAASVRTASHKASICFCAAKSSPYLKFDCDFTRPNSSPFHCAGRHISLTVALWLVQMKLRWSVTQWLCNCLKITMGKYLKDSTTSTFKNIQNPTVRFTSCCLICPALSKLKLRSASASSRSKSSIFCRKFCKELMASPETPVENHGFCTDSKYV